MWNRKELKTAGKKSFRADYWQAVIVSLFVVILASVRGLSRMGELKTGQALIDVGFGRLGTFFTGLSETDSESIATYLVSKAHASQGILATVLNETSDSGSFLYGLVNGVNDLLFKDGISHGIILIIAAVVLFLYWFFFQNIIQVGKHRFFLEMRMYPETKFNRILFVYRIKRVQNVAKAMFMESLFLTLWCLTIVGGFIKLYSYRMVPKILAENPSISWRDAILTSRKMMDGHKWRTFLLDLSFLGWMILSFITFGLVSVFYVHPYREATDVELYMALRENELAEDKSAEKIFNDDFLTEKPVGKYHAGQEDEENNEYPIALFSVPDRHKSLMQNLDPKRKYSITDLILLFFSLCMVGYFYEVIYYIVAIGEVVNRGTMYGPWLPIYGIGGIVTLLLLRRWADKPVITFSAAFVLSGVIEYFTAWYLETFKHVKWWDYTGFFCNIDGRVCLEQLIVFGLACCLNIYIVSPFLAGVFEKLSKKTIIFLCILLVVLFTADFILSINHPNMAAGVPA